MTNYIYDAANRLSNVAGQTYTWDDNGDLLNDGATQYAYDQANRLISATLGTTTTQYIYNGDGARLKQIVNGSPTTYTLDLAAPLVQVLTAKDNSSETRYLYGLTRIGEQQSTGWVYHVTDALGSVRQLADANAQVVLTRGYTPYGEPLWSKGTGQSAYGYTGEALDVSTGLVFLRARYMNPQLGMFLARDPWSGAILQPGTMNGWGYGLGNPIRHIDPSGYLAQDWDFRVHLEDAGGPLERIPAMDRFKDEYWNFGFLEGDFWNVLGREQGFVRWLINSGRLQPGNWYDVSDAYLTAARFAGARVAKYLESHERCADAQLGGLEPSVVQWAAVVLVADGYRPDAETAASIGLWQLVEVYSGILNVGFWGAHNAGLREGVRRADARGLRDSQPLYEQGLMNFVLYDVLEPGDQCATGNQAFCSFTLQAELELGVSAIYPQQWPATRDNLDLVQALFLPIYNTWHALGARLPSDEVHLVDSHLKSLDIPFPHPSQ